MVQSVATWDNALFGCPQVEGYSASRQTLLRGSEPVDGATRFREDLEEGMTSFQVTVPQTLAQYEAWVAFYESTLDYGKFWFTMSLALGTDVKPFIVHLAEDWAVRNVRVDASFGELQLSLEAFDQASSVLVFDPPIVIDGGTATSPSPVGDLIDSGTATSPSPDTDIIFGGDYVDIQL